MTARPILSEEYRADNVTVFVEWTHDQEEHVTYNVTIIPSVPITFISSTSIWLILLYNVEYNVSLNMVTVCQRVTSSHVQLFYSKFLSAMI